MNTIQKIIASSVVNGTAAYFFRDQKQSFVHAFTGNSIFSCLRVILDKYINQNITSNKAIQYGMLAAENVVGFFLISGLSNKQGFSEGVKKYFEALFSEDCNNNCALITISLISFSFLHKYIWDQPNDTNVEFDQSKEIIIPIDALESI